MKVLVIERIELDDEEGTFTYAGWPGVPGAIEYRLGYYRLGGFQRGRLSGKTAR